MTIFKSQLVVFIKFTLLAAVFSLVSACTTDTEQTDATEQTDTTEQTSTTEQTGTTDQAVPVGQTETEPEPVVTTEPEPVVITEPAPVITEPVVITEPEPVVITEPEPVVVIEPEPVVITEPEPDPVVITEPDPVVTPEPDPVIIPEPAPTNTSLKIDVMQASSGSNYVLDTLQTGKTVYIDRDYTYTTLPVNFEGMCYARTANNDKLYAGSDFLKLVVNKPVNAYVGFDVRSTLLPTWLESWTDTGIQIGTSDAQLRIFKQEFASGDVNLGGNEMGNSMYAVFIEDPSATENTYCNGSNATVKLSWQPNVNTVDGYNVYYGFTADTVNQLASNLPITSVGFDAQVPSVQLNIKNDLGLNAGEYVCFKITAYNTSSESELSVPECVTI